MGPEAVAPLVFAAALSLGAAGMLVWYGKRARAAAVLRRRLGQLAPTTGDELMRAATASDGVMRALAESGLAWTPGELLTRIAVAGALGLVLGLAAGSGTLALLLGLGGCAAIGLIVRRARARRLALCDEQLPQALEIMALAMRAGHALPGALQLAAQEAPAPLCHELQRAHDEQQLGRPIHEVLIAMNERLPGCEGIGTFVVAVSVLQETGGNLIGVIDRIVENARSRSGYQARLRALTAEGRQSARLLAFLPGGFFALAMLSDPSYAGTLLGDGGGRMILGVAVGLWMVGLLWTRRLVAPMT